MEHEIEVAHIYHDHALGLSPTPLLNVLSTPKYNSDLRAMTKALKIAKRRSKIHGNGVIATARIRKGEDIVEYKGRIITHDEADAQYYGDVGSGHTFLFTLNDEWIVDANVRGNIAKWINTGCDPNAIAFIHSEKKKNPDPKKDRVIIEALRTIEPGEEVIYDYGFEFDVPYTKKLLKAWACKCGSPKCTGSMLKNAPASAGAGKKAKKDPKPKERKASK